MFQMRQIHELVSTTASVQYEQEVQYFLRPNTEKTYTDAIHHNATHTIPHSIPGTPAWHKRRLDELKAVIAARGLPHLFLKLKSDEFSPTRWSEIDSLQHA